MISFRWTTLAAIASMFLHFAPTSSAAVNTTCTISASHNITTSPKFLVYSDADSSGSWPPPVSAISGFNVFAISFLMVSGAEDKAQQWASMSSSQRSTIKAQYAAAGIKLIVSAFGSEDAPTTNGANPITTANTMAQWVKDHDLDGIDVDYEDFNSLDGGSGKAEAWIISFTTQLRTLLPQGQYIITHAPVAPWFSPNIWGGGGYLKVHSVVGNLIDWYNIQFYNQGSKEYVTCSGLLAQSSSTFPQSALFQIAANGVPLSKLVVGKPATSTAASDGFIAPAALAGCLKTAVNGGWTGGVSVWEFPGAASAWISTVRNGSFPLQ
ncbi:glycoside hydrolase family 18 protein [Roridomyces roridus]|uniref:Glycoside hydrolase family 18 protein n=1 Tax=Roridomyces roridus TaxID=1738132 RepID=A0AAD7BK24_9AGAR|nr:glycoside hydrolase family 18 protein [Roridomyces roridus]